MDTHIVSQLEHKLQRLNTNDSSASESIFSRNPSSTSVATAFPSPHVLSKSLSFTKLHQEIHSPLDLNNDFNADALHLALSKIPSNNGNPKSLNKLTTTPTNEVNIDTKWCIVLVGLPATGKSSICKNLIKSTTSYFQQNHHADFKIDSFNAGHFRRKLSDFKNQTSDYFDFKNQEAKNQRELFAHIALDHLLNSLLNSQIDVGIFDATNSTRERRDYILHTIKEKEKKTGIKINTLILHVKCSDQQLWKYNVEGKTSGPDYINSNHDVAIRDFIHRADLYRSAFEDITQEELENNPECVYMQVDNAGKDISVNANGFNGDEDLVYKELVDFIKNYHDNYGKVYEDKVESFWKKTHA